MNFLQSVSTRVPYAYYVPLTQILYPLPLLQGGRLSGCGENCTLLLCCALSSVVWISLKGDRWDVMKRGWNRETSTEVALIKENKGCELGIPSWLQQLYLHPIITIIYSGVGNPFKWVLLVSFQPLELGWEREYSILPFPDILLLAYMCWLDKDEIPQWWYESPLQTETNNLLFSTSSYPFLRKTKPKRDAFRTIYRLSSIRVGII